MVGHVTGKNTSLPILNNILIEAKDGKIRLAATNLEVGVSHVVRGKIEKEGDFTVDARIVSDYVSLLPNSKIDVEKEGSGLIISCENYKTKINGQTTDDYPLIPGIKKESPRIVEAEEFKKALAQVVFAAATSETRLELSGVLFIFNKNELILAATDSYRLAEKKIKLKNNELGGKNVSRAIVPVKTVQEMVRILSGSKEERAEVEIYLAENQILFVSGSTELISRLIEGQYPDYQQIIPTLNKTNAQANRLEVSQAVKAAALFSKSGINDVSLDFPKNKKQIIVSASSGQTGENITKVDATVAGEDNAMVVNYRYLLDGLNNIEEEEIRLEVIDSNTPCLLRPAKKNDYLYIIMPIKQ